MKTQHLRLMPFTSQDLTLFHAINTNPFVRKFLWDGQIISQKTAREIPEENERSFTKNKWGLWKVFEQNSNTFVGYIGLWTSFQEIQPPLLFAFLPEFTGKGYATEASRKLFDMLLNS
ncbi:GNAT family N-acetyltransferase [Rapidithrix thailandica]|uniref:GNAT family N-acetyltransferase n=1 Tax=Rapidithrix thailandica TaxID=413964 RepID=A0AAW9SGL6_9BACT